MIEHQVEPFSFHICRARYVFLLFEQSDAFNNQTWVTHTTPAAFFNISTFAAAARLGQPIGGTYMLVGPDPSTS